MYSSCHVVLAILFPAHDAINTICSHQSASGCSSNRTHRSPQQGLIPGEGTTNPAAGTSHPCSNTSMLFGTATKWSWATQGNGDRRASEIVSCARVGHVPWNDQFSVHSGWADGSDSSGEAQAWKKPHTPTSYPGQEKNDRGTMC